MKYALEIRERVNPGNYEYVEISGRVEFDDEDTAEQDPAEFGREQLDALLDSHRRRALQMLPDDSESFMIYHPALEE